MATKKASADTIAVITAIRESQAAARVVADVVAAELVAHTKLDDARHAENTAKLSEIQADLKSLLESRSFSRGLWKAAAVAGTLAGALISALIAWVKGGH